jgi:hypothetical protein
MVVFVTIYFIESPEEGLIKIGFSNNVKHRLDALQKNYGRPLNILLVKSGTKEDEAVIHEMFNELRIKGEWFAATEKIKEFIKESNSNTEEDYESDPRDSVRVNVRVTPDNLVKLKAKAKNSATTVSALLSIAVSNYCDTLNNKW